MLPRPRLDLDNCSSNLPRDENFDFKNFFDRPTWNSLLTYLVVVWVSSYWSLIAWSIMDCVLCFIATICISYTLFTNFVRYCCLASASSFLPRPRLVLENFPAASSSSILPRVHQCWQVDWSLVSLPLHSSNRMADRQTDMINTKRISSSSWVVVAWTTLSDFITISFCHTASI